MLMLCDAERQVAFPDPGCLVWRSLILSGLSEFSELLVLPAHFYLGIQMYLS